MKTKSIHNVYISILTIGLSLIFSLGMVEGAEAAKKAKFRYDKPNVSQWLNYCQKKHPEKTLKRCCARRQGSCKARCEKSKYPNTAYANKTQCVSDCRNTQQRCVAKGKGSETPKPKPEITSLSGRAVANFKQCHSINKVVDHNVCCEGDGWHACLFVCDSARNQQVRDKCYRECNTHRNGCYKKHTTRAYAKMKKQSPNFRWMNTYCSKSKNRRGRTYDQCCNSMEERCSASCEGYPDTDEAINSCRDRCSKASSMCNAK